MQHRSIPITALLSISLVLAGCAGTKDSVLPRDGKSMKEIYEEHVQEMGLDDPRVARAELGARGIGTLDRALEGYTRQAHDELDTTFPRLPNPTLMLYVFPHLAGAERVPVPGYVTTFPMYERVEYALPGEVAGGASAVAP